MKKISLILISLGLVLFALNSLGQKIQQNSSTDRDVDRMRLRMEMHRRMLEKVLHGNGPDQGLFDDMQKMIDDTLVQDMMPSDILNQDGLSGSGQSQVWTENELGRTLTITPKDPKIPLDIKVENGFIVLSSKQVDQNSSKSFQSMVNVPGDCDEKKVKIKAENNNIVVFFPFRSSKPKTVPDRLPVQKIPGEETI
jgi:hypothetical protein